LNCGARNTQTAGESQDAIEAVIGIGRRVVVLANLGLSPHSSPPCEQAALGIANALDSWEGPGTVVVAGNLLDLRAPDSDTDRDQDLANTAERAFKTHSRLTASLRAFASGPDRRLLCLPGTTDYALATDDAVKATVERLGAQVAPAVDLLCETAAGPKRVKVLPGCAPVQICFDQEPGPQDPEADKAQAAQAAQAGHPNQPGQPGGHELAPVADVPWQGGMDRLADRSALRRLVTSRTVYRWLGRHAWWLAVPFLIVLLLSLPATTWVFGHVFPTHPGPVKALHRVRDTRVGARLLVAALVALVELIAAGSILLIVSRRRWSSLGGGHLEGVFGVGANNDANTAASDGSTTGTSKTSRGSAARAVAAPAVAAGAPAEAASASSAGIAELDVDPGEEQWSEPVSGTVRAGTTGNDSARDIARDLVASGYAGVVSGATLQAELTHLGTGFFACPGTAGEVVEEYPGRFGLPPVFLAHRQIAWIELETGADLHARLLLARSDIRPSTLLERFAARHQAQHDTTPVVVAAHPSGGSWPPAPDLSSTRKRSRRARRLASVSIAVAGLLDLVSAVTPPLRSHLALVRQVLPLEASQAAGALVALVGLGLLALARGVRRGQHRAWLISVVLLASTLILHIARGADITAWVVSAAVLGVLLAFRQEFRGASDRPSLRSAIVALVVGAVGITVITTFVAQLSMVIHHDRDRPRLWVTGQAVAERLVGVTNIALPDRLDDFLAPSLVTIGITLVAVALWLATRPVVDRHTTGRAAEARARDIVRRHGAGTLDYFALRSDKKRFFHRDSVVAYAIYGGVCLVSPDPIGPPTDRAQTWAAFRRFADSRGWVLAIMGASEEWLPLYRATGMHDIYIGDEAIVDVQHFSLAGGHMKGLRQAANRIAKYGYTATFHDPSTLAPDVARSLAGLMSQSRRGETERGFSMMLGRIFDPRDEDLVLCAVWAPDGSPAAMCQFVPASGIGGYSLDLMRRDRGDHPNGLIDFALVSTIEHLRQSGARGLSMNFAAMRSILDGERGDGVAERVERWALKRMSSFLQIETLWRFNAKYEPSWIPRYIVYDSAEHLVPAVLAILRAESLWEVPVIGKMLGAAERRIHGEHEDPSAAIKVSAPAP
jgi:lysylphosphatidylglycerol synthetase-like protein (DUF2156 family)